MFSLLRIRNKYQCRVRAHYSITFFTHRCASEVIEDQRQKSRWELPDYMVRPNTKKALFPVTSPKPKVGRLFLIIFFQKEFYGQNRRKIRFAKTKMFKTCDKSVFWVIFVGKKGFDRVGTIF